MLRCTILVAIGANLPGPGGRDALASCEWAATRLAGLAGLHLRARSRWYRSTPVPPSGQPDYVNGAALLSGTADPHALLRSLHEIESRGGRVRGAPNAARTLDLDLLAIDDLVLHEPGLTLPHPRLHERAFVLAPLCDLVPLWRHPVLHRTAAQLLAGCDRAGLFTLDGAEILAGSPPPP